MRIVCHGASIRAYMLFDCEFETSVVVVIVVVVDIPI